MVRSPALATLVMLTMATTLSLNMFLPALPEMAHDFGVSYGTISLSVGLYLAVTAVLALILGPLSDRFGRRPVALGILSVFTLASAGAALSQQIETFLVCRLAQGVMVGGFILASAIVRDTREESEVARLLAYITSAMAVAPLLGPLLGGFVLGIANWRAIFWIYAGLGIVLMLVCFRDLVETRKLRTKDTLRAPFALMRSRQFLALITMMAFSTSCFYAFLAGTPLVAAATFGFTGPQLGIALGSITAGFIVGSLLAGRLSRRIGPARLMLSGRSATLAGLSIGLVLTWAQPSNPLVLFGATLAIGLGNGLSLPSGNAMILSLNPDQAGTASGITGATTVGAGAIMTTLAAWALQFGPTPLALTGLLWTLALVAFLAGLIAYQGRN